MKTGAMTERFQKYKWGPERTTLEAMEPGAEASFNVSTYYTTKAAVSAVNHAYHGEREYKLTRRGEKVTVARLK
jgi:hypothetical protein